MTQEFLLPASLLIMSSMNMLMIRAITMIPWHLGHLLVLTINHYDYNNNNNDVQSNFLIIKVTKRKK